MIPALSAIPSAADSTSNAKCPAIVDPSGDARAAPLVSGGANFLLPNVAAYDIVSADIASSNQALSIIIRVKELATRVASSPTGIFWRFDFTAGDSSLFGEVVSDTSSDIGQPAGLRGYIGNVDGTAHFIKAENPLLDFRHNEVHLRFPIADFGVLAPPMGTKLTDLKATGGRWYDTAAFTVDETDDSATTDNVYILGHRTCIKV